MAHLSPLTGRYSTSSRVWQVYNRQNLVVSKGRGAQYRIISGERRYRALKLLEEQGKIDGEFAVPVELRSGLGKDDKLRLATIENVQRENLAPLDEAAALAALLRKGVRLDDMAAKTGLSVSTIRRRLALNDLCDEARAALSEGAVTLAQAEALTLGNGDAQQRILDDLGSGYGPDTAAEIRDHLLDDRPCVAMAIFPLEQYTGTITTDLFAEDEQSYFDDAGQFMALQQEAVTALAASHAETADWVELTEQWRIPEWQYEKAGVGEPAGVVINLAPSGRVDVLEGLARPEIDPDDAEATAGSPAAPPKPKPAYSGAVCRMIAWHKSVAVQELLLADPRKAKELEAAQRLDGFHPHEALLHLAAEKLGQRAYRVMEEQARLYAGLLGFIDGEDEQVCVWRRFPPRGLSDRALYEAVCALRDHELDGLLTLLTALAFGQENCGRFDTGDSLFNRAARDLGVDMRGSWRPDRAFFERRTTAQLLDLAQECGCADLYGIGRLRTYKKTELVGTLLRHFASAFEAQEPSEAQRKARDSLPEVMLFPAVDPDALTKAA
jgi:ParB family transcriptional regulator, chromosome partitioning protein